MSSAVLMSFSLGVFPHPFVGFSISPELRIILYISVTSKSFDEAKFSLSRSENYNLGLDCVLVIVLDVIPCYKCHVN